MDINQLNTKEAHDEGAEMRVIGPDGKMTDVYIKLVGVDSAKWRKIKSRLERKTMMATLDDDDSDDEENSLNAITDATLDWRGLTKDSNSLPFSKVAAKNLYISAPYIRDQADRFIAKRINFIETSLIV
jgi:hypothetical protein